MRKNVLLLFVLLLSSKIFGQINLENTFPVNSVGQRTVGFNFVKLSSGEMYVLPETLNKSIKIYNSNHSLFKTISIPLISLPAGTSLSGISIHNVSDELFNLDTKIEYLALYSIYNSTLNKSARFIRVWNEDGTLIFSKDSATVNIDYLGFIPGYQGIVKTSTGTKLVIGNEMQNNWDYELYSLPGSVIASNNNPLKVESGSLSNPIPNPSSQLTKIEFELPKGVSNGEISFYTMDGTIIKKYMVDNTFGDLLLNNSDLPTGIYYYKLNAGTTHSDAKKMVVIK